MNYSDTHIEECIDYLKEAVGEGNLDPDVATELIAKKDWATVYEMIHKEDDHANDNERQND
jgi:hypothetical protein